MTRLHLTWLTVVCAALGVAILLAPQNAYAGMDQGEAYAACKKSGSDTIAAYKGGSTECNDNGAMAYLCKFSHPQATGGGWVNCNREFWFPYEDSCQSRNSRNPPGDAALWYSAPSTCIGGCRLLGTPFSSESGGVKVYGMKDRYYSGDVCEAPSGPPGIGPDPPTKESESKPKPSECVALGNGQTACTRPDGDQCATASTGKTFCWKPGETGEKKDGPDAQTKGEKGKPVMPPTSDDPTKEYQRKEGHQQTACINNTCTTYNVTNYGQTGKGEAKNSTGDNNSDGTGNTSGNGTPGKGSGGGGKEGEGDSASDSGNCDTPPLCTGDTLKCLHLRFTWKIQCNTKGSEISKGDGCGDNDVPVCAGSSCKAEAYAQLLQQWRARCSVEKLTKGVEDHAGQGDGDDGKGSIFIDDSGKNPSLDEGKVSYAGGQLGYSFEVEGVKFEMPQQVLDFLPILRMLIIALATLAAIGIMRGNG